jgi:hypothetical protein
LYSNVERSDAYKNHLINFIKREYDIEAVGITPAKRGFYGETWRLDTSDTSYFLKLVYLAVHKPVYERSFYIVQHLCNHGIDFISRIVKTANGRLFTQFDGAILGDDLGRVPFGFMPRNSSFNRGCLFAVFCALK